MIELPVDRAIKFCRNHVCARCYGDINYHLVDGWNAHKNDRSIILCGFCGEAWGGTVIKKKTAEKRGTQFVQDFKEIKYSELGKEFSEIFGYIPPQRHNVQKMLAELGF